MRKQFPSEAWEQRIVVTWLRHRNIAHTHVPNGGYRTKIEGAILKGLGTNAGVPDVLVFNRPPKAPDLCGVAIEMKRIKGSRVSDLQSEWIDTLRACGWVAEICYGAEAAIRLLTEYGYDRRFPSVTTKGKSE